MTIKQKALLGSSFALLLAAVLLWTFNRQDGPPASTQQSADASGDGRAAAKTNTATAMSGSNAMSAKATLPATNGVRVGVSPLNMQNSSIQQAYRVFRSTFTARDALSAINAASTVSKQDKLYFNALLSEYCSDPSFEKARASQPQTTPVAAVNDATPPERQRARERINRQRARNYCEGMPALTADAQRAAWAEAASAGDTRSQARLGWAAFEATFKPDPTVPANGPLTPEQTLSPRAWDSATVNSLVHGLASRDPAAIVNIGQMLQQSAHTNFVVLASTGTSLSDMPIATWDVVACHYSAQCGPENTTVLARCANEGHCDVTNLEEYYRRYVWTAEEAARYDALLPLLRDLIDKEDTSLLSILTFDPSKAPPTHYYGKPPRPYRPN